jgi:hypothetical protein
MVFNCCSCRAELSWAAKKQGSSAVLVIGEHSCSKTYYSIFRVKAAGCNVLQIKFDSMAQCKVAGKARGFDWTRGIHKPKVYATVWNMSYLISKVQLLLIFAVFGFVLENRTFWIPL